MWPMVEYCCSPSKMPRSRRHTPSFTNVLVYLFSNSEPIKKNHCTRLIRKIKNDVVLVWSTQVVQELYQILTKKFNKEPQKVKSILGQFDEIELIVNNIDIINNAIDIQTLNKFSFWDCLILSAAQLSKCSTVLSEDMNHGQLVNGVIIQNPFNISS